MRILALKLVSYDGELFSLKSHFKSISMSTLKARNGMNYPGGVAIFPYMLASPLTFAIYRWSGYCKCAMKQKERRIFSVRV